MKILRKILIAILVILALLGIAGFFLLRGDTADLTLEEVQGTDPTLQEPNEEGFPTVNIAKPIGWEDGDSPTAAEGLTVQRFAEGLDHPRVMHALPNGDILVTLTRSPGGFGEDDSGVMASIRNFIAGILFERAGSAGESPNQLVLLRDADGDGAAETQVVLRDDLESPSGIAWRDDTLYIANHNALISFPYQLGDDAIASEPKKLMDLPAGGGHWMRNIELHPDGDRLYIAVGSVSNIGESGMEVEQGRAMIWEYGIESGSPRQYGVGLRNPNGLDFNPWSGELWTTVNERDMLGSDLVPDYLTNVPAGAQYGWPWVYYRDNLDERVEAPRPQYLIEYARRPEFAMGPHVAALGLVFTTKGARMGDRFSSGAFVANHGSWNRKPASGYNVVYVEFDDRGNPQGKPIEILGGFLNDDDTTKGRPTWVEWASDGALLVSDDTAGIIWRVIDPKAKPRPPIERPKRESLRPQKELRGDPRAVFGEDDYARRTPAQ